MKNFVLALVLLASVQVASAQYKKARLQASGLTCAMCSNAINKAIQTLPFVESIETDLNQSAFEVVFKGGQQVDFDQIRRKVEGAGFSVAQLEVWAQFDGIRVQNDRHLVWGNQTLHFLNVKDQVLQGEQKFTLLDKYFVPAKDLKKYSTYTRKACYKSGVAENCCSQEGVPAQTRIFHVTI